MAGPNGGKRPGAGRPKGAKAKKTIEAERALRPVLHRAAKLMDLTEDQILALLPKDVFRLVMQQALREKNTKLALEVAEKWAPYEHAKRTETVYLSPEELRHAADLARSEAARRGYDIPDAPGPAARALPH